MIPILLLSGFFVAKIEEIEERFINVKIGRQPSGVSFHRRHQLGILLAPWRRQNHVEKRHPLFKFTDESLSYIAPSLTVVREQEQDRVIEGGLCEN